MLTKYMLLHPTVFACGDKYQMFVSLSEDAVMKVRVGDEIYYDHINGILRSATKIHKVEIPMELLNREKRYTVCYKRILERKTYFPFRYWCIFLPGIGSLHCPRRCTLLVWYRCRRSSSWLGSRRLVRSVSLQNRFAASCVWHEES